MITGRIFTVLKRHTATLYLDGENVSERRYLDIAEAIAWLESEGVEEVEIVK